MAAFDASFAVFSPPNVFFALGGRLCVCEGTNPLTPWRLAGVACMTLEDACANRSQHRVLHRHCLPCTASVCRACLPLSTSPRRWWPLPWMPSSTPWHQPCSPPSSRSTRMNLTLSRTWYNVYSNPIHWDYDRTTIYRQDSGRGQSGGSGLQLWHQSEGHRPPLGRPMSFQIGMQLILMVRFVGRVFTKGKTALRCNSQCKDDDYSAVSMAKCNGLPRRLC